MKDAKTLKSIFLRNVPSFVIESVIKSLPQLEVVRCIVIR